MKEEDRQFEAWLKDAVGQYHEEEMRALTEDAQIKEERLSDAFYEKMECLMQQKKRRPFLRIMKYAAAAAVVLVLASGTVGMAAYALIGAEKFQKIFEDYISEHQACSSVVMDLKQLQDMALSKTGTVYEDDAIRLEAEGMIKSGNMLSMLLKGTLKQRDSIIVPDGPQDMHGYGFLEQSLETDGDYESSTIMYFQEEDKELAENQFVCWTNYVSEDGFENDVYTFTFRDFGYDKYSCEDAGDVPEGVTYEAEDVTIPICSGTWTFSVDMDQAKDLSVKRAYNLAVTDGARALTVKDIQISPLGCSVWLTGIYEEDTEGCADYFEKVRIRLKDGSYLDEAYYDLSFTQSVTADAQGEDVPCEDVPCGEMQGEGAKEKGLQAEEELRFEFHVPIDIRKVEAVELFGADCEIIAP